MKSSAWRQLNWLSILLHSFYVLAVGVALAFFGRLFGLAESMDFPPLLTIAVALAVVFTSYRLILREGREPLAYGLALGLIVGLAWFVPGAVTTGVSVSAIAGLLIQILGGLLGARMASRTLHGDPS